MSMPPLLNKGPSLPAWVKRRISECGTNPNGAPMFRLVWSEDKQMWLDGELIPEYDFAPPRWVLEKWLSPEEFAGSEIMHDYMVVTKQHRGGPYPRLGYYFGTEVPLPVGLELNADVITLLCSLLMSGRAMTQQERLAAIREREANKKSAELSRLRDLQEQATTAASLGKEQTGYGAKNNLRTPDDWERENASGSLTTNDLPGMPRGGALKQY